MMLQYSFRSHYSIEEHIPKTPHAQHPPIKIDEEKMAEEDVDNMDSMPFNDNIPDDNFEEDFHECGTWSKDDEGHVMPRRIL